MRRREPTQARGRVTVQRLLRAAESLFVRYGYAKVSTTRIARRAGISVAALYQYFPDKRAIAAALLEATASHAAKLIRLQIKEDLHLSHAEGARSTVTKLLSIYEEHEVVLLRLTDDVPELREEAGSLLLESLTQSAQRAFLEQRADASQRARLESMLFVLHAMTFDTVRAFVLEKPRSFTREEFIEELCQCLLAYYAAHGIVDA